MKGLIDYCTTLAAQWLRGWLLSHDLPHSPHLRVILTPRPQIQASISIDPSSLNEIITTLNKDNQVEFFTNANKEIIFKYVPPGVEGSGKKAFSSKEEEFVYQCIARAGDRGIWTKDIKIQSGLTQQALMKIYKVLEGRLAIKTVKSIASKSKKMYMLYDIEPAKELTGGPWYTDQDFDHEFIDELRNYCFGLISTTDSQSVSEITARLVEDNISKVKLTEQDVQQLVRTLELDGKVEKDEEDGEVRYRSMVPLENDGKGEKEGGGKVRVGGSSTR